MANGFKIDSPRTAHDIAYAAAWDKVSVAQRARIGKGSRAKRLTGSITPLRMTPADRELFCEEVSRWYRAFGILSASQWMPEGYEWRKEGGRWQPMPVAA